MSFLPLVIWFLGFWAIWEYADHNRRKDGREPIPDEASEVMCWICVVGCVVLIAVGILK